MVIFVRGVLLGTIMARGEVLEDGERCNFRLGKLLFVRDDKYCMQFY